MNKSTSSPPCRRVRHGFHLMELLVVCPWCSTACRLLCGLPLPHGPRPLKAKDYAYEYLFCRNSGHGIGNARPQMLPNATE